MVSWGAKTALAPAKNPRTMTPVHRPQKRRAMRPIPRTSERRCGSRRARERTVRWASRRMLRPRTSSGPRDEHGDDDDDGPDRRRRRLHPEGAADVVLPADEPPRVEDRPEEPEADEDRDDDGAHPAAQPRDPEVVPQRVGGRAEAVADGHRHPGGDALEPPGARQQGGDERGGERPGGTGEADTAERPVQDPLRPPEHRQPRARPHAGGGLLDEGDGHGRSSHGCSGMGARGGRRRPPGGRRPAAPLPL